MDRNIRYAEDVGSANAVLSGFSPTAAWVDPSVRSLNNSIMNTATGQNMGKALRTLAISGLG